MPAASRKLFSILLLLALLGCHRSASNGALVAEIGTTKITRGEFLAYLKVELKSYGKKILGDSKSFAEVKRQMLQRFIDQKILVQAAVEGGAKVEDAELKQEFLRFKSQYSDVAFLNMLREAGLTEEQWRQNKADLLRVKKFLDAKIETRPELTQKNLEKEYQQHPENFSIPESVRVRQIVTDSKEKAEGILARLQKGENFAKLARSQSLSPDRRQGGDLGFIAKGNYPREFDVCFQMNPGEISPIIPSVYGFHLFKVLEKEPARTLDFSEVEGKLRQQQRQKLREQVREEVLKNSKTEARVQIHEAVLAGIAAEDLNR